MPFVASFATSMLEDAGTSFFNVVHVAVLRLESACSAPADPRVDCTALHLTCVPAYLTLPCRSAPSNTIPLPTDRLSFTVTVAFAVTPAASTTNLPAARQTIPIRLGSLCQTQTFSNLELPLRTIITGAASFSQIDLPTVKNTRIALSAHEWLRTFLAASTVVCSVTLRGISISGLAADTHTSFLLQLHPTGEAAHASYLA
ncbi:uncharacterized protein CLUP02_05570 [Colletotrichum lupini]|uniref:Uncharacterized protein n=1 Tax=Colletotrichum lupini TaxID=145971 RepID=A0A9Q8SN12_9PEZI|nr:uncharacterized protein CLUP02_05570 [Colletotrichum lupini]UQC80088.1 hypothetical protein CLUP02_05570 [Colletotrichum lupini]